MIENSWSTAGIIAGREPDHNIYDVGYFSGNRAFQGIQFPTDGSYLNPESAYQNKFIDTLSWIKEYVPEGRLLDVGSGPAHLTYWAKKLSLPFEVYSCDISQPILKWASTNNKATPVVADGYRIPFANNTFQGILFSDILEHMWPNDSLKAVEDAKRMLTKNGNIFINIPNRVTWNDAAKKDQGHVWLPSVAEMKEMLKNVGFERKSIKTFTRGFPLSEHYHKVVGSDLRLPFYGRSIFVTGKKTA